MGIILADAAQQVVEEIKHAVQSFSGYSLRTKLIITVGILILILCAVAGLHRAGERWREARYKKAEAVRLRQVQELLSAAEQKTREAEAKEAQARLLAEQNAARSSAALSRQQQILTEAKATDEKIQSDYAADRARIAGDADSCARCRDAQTRLERLKQSNPALSGAGFDCTEICAGQ